MPAVPPFPPPFSPPVPVVRPPAHRIAAAARLILLLSILAGVVASAAAAPPAPDPAPTTAQALSRALVDELSADLLPPGLTTDEFRSWCDARVARLVVPDDANRWTADADQLRQKLREQIVLRGAPAAWRESRVRVEWSDWEAGGADYRYRRLRYEALPGLWIPAVLYEPLAPPDASAPARRPVALHVNGHDPLGKAAPYKQIRSINLARRGVLTLNVEWLGMGQLRGAGYSHGRMNQLELAGVSGLAPFYLAMEKALDLLLADPQADPGRTAVSGLSGGGWQTIFLSALDPRVTLANPVAGYSSFRTRLARPSDLGDSEQTPTDMAALADYTHLTALRAPRPTLLTYNAKDECCFAAAHALPPLVEAAAPAFRLLNAAGRLRTHVNETPGTHNFERENREAYYEFLGDSFALPGETWVKSELDCQGLLKSPEQLSVELPADNADFRSLARDLASRLPRDAAPPATSDPAALEAWRNARRATLAELLRTPTMPLVASIVAERRIGDVHAIRWRWKLAEAWTVPAVEFRPARPTGSTLIVADAGRKSTAALVEAELRAGRRVVACDPFYWGESAYPQRAYLYALLAASVGDRPLGLQARQIQAAARWLAARPLPDPSTQPAPETAAKEPAEPAAKPGAGPVELIAVGPRSTLAALAAAALEPDAVDRLRLHQSLGSLHELLELDWSFEQAPECFCFGLLARFDVRSLVELVAPREVRFVQPSERVLRETAPVAAWYRRLGSSFSPVDATGSKE